MPSKIQQLITKLPTEEFSIGDILLSKFQSGKDTVLYFKKYTLEIEINYSSELIAESVSIEDINLSITADSMLSIKSDFTSAIHKAESIIISSVEEEFKKAIQIFTFEESC
jgi:hypothetical protein